MCIVIRLGLGLGLKMIRDGWEVEIICMMLMRMIDIEIVVKAVTG